MFNYNISNNNISVCVIIPAYAFYAVSVQEAALFAVAPIKPGAGQRNVFTGCGYGTSTIIYTVDFEAHVQGLAPHTHRL